MKEQHLAKSGLILEIVTGSHLYGTETPTSDLDYMGVFIPPKEYVLGLHHCDQVMGDADGKIQGKHVNHKVDRTIYSLVKYIDLATNNNPNILSLLYAPENRIRFINDFGRKLVDAKDLFLCKRAYHTFRGYAHGQRKRVVAERTDATNRRESIDTFGYDPKFAMHMIRLLYECLDILTCGELVYPSPHARILREIRSGAWALDKIVAEADRIELLCDEALVRSSLRHSPDRVGLEQLQMELLQDWWKSKDETEQFFLTKSPASVTKES